MASSRPTFAVHKVMFLTKENKEKQQALSPLYTFNMVSLTVCELVIVFDMFYTSIKKVSYDTLQ